MIHIDYQGTDKMHALTKHTACRYADNLVHIVLHQLHAAGNGLVHSCSLCSVQYPWQ